MYLKDFTVNVSNDRCLFYLELQVMIILAVDHSDSYSLRLIGESEKLKAPFS